MAPLRPQTGGQPGSHVLPQQAPHGPGQLSFGEPGRTSGAPQNSNLSHSNHHNHPNPAQPNQALPKQPLPHQGPPGHGIPAPRPVRQQPATAIAAPTEDYDLDEPEAPRRRFPLKTAAAFVLLSALGGGAYALHKSGHLQLSSLPFVTSGGEKTVPVVRAPTAASKEQPVGKLSGSPKDIDDGLQKAGLWQVIKREFPDWYNERVQDTVRLRGEQKDDKAIAVFLTQALVDLRRKNAEAVLASSPDRLKFVAVTFVENLAKLAKHSTDACYGFISQGESSPAVAEVLQLPEHSASMNGQFKAIIEAAAEGRKAPKSHGAPRREDYDVLAAQLAERGWSPADLQTFSDARALARAKPERVCQMVQDWFLAQLAVKDEGVQIRLLVEALKPVVAG